MIINFDATALLTLELMFCVCDIHFNICMLVLSHNVMLSNNICNVGIGVDR